MGTTDKLWSALTTVITMEGKVKEQETRAREQQAKIESLTERVIRLETQMDMLLIGAGAKRRQGRLES
jgi:hypothetical protein